MKLLKEYFSRAIWYTGHETHPLCLRIVLAGATCGSWMLLLEPHFVSSCAPMCMPICMCK